MKPQKRLVEPFSFQGNRVGCLLIHGFSGSPSEMRWIGERLAKLGWTVLGIQLSGHGTTPEEMAKTRWEDWAKDAEAGVRTLRESCDSVIGVGLSMGGLLVLHLATLGLVDGIITMNAPMILADRRTRYARLLWPFITFVGKPSPSHSGLKSSATSTASERNAEYFVYERIPVGSLISLNRGIRQVRRKLYLIKCPALLMQSRKDLTVNPISVQILREKIRQVEPEVLYWEKSGHILTLSSEREEVAHEINDFLRQFTIGDHVV